MNRSASGRYSDPVEREQLIQRLLRERDQSRQKVEENNTVYDNAATNGKIELAVISMFSMNIFYRSSLITLVRLCFSSSNCISIKLCLLYNRNRNRNQ